MDPSINEIELTQEESAFLMELAKAGEKAAEDARAPYVMQSRACLGMIYRQRGLTGSWNADPDLKKMRRN